MWDQKIMNGTLVSGEKRESTNLYIKDGKIAAISSEDLGDAREVIDATGKYVLPGLMDTHIHSRDPGTEYKEDFFHSTKAAAMGGLTTVFEMPNTNPPINNVDNLHKQIENLSAKAHVDFGIWAICLGRLNLNELKELNKAGVIGFKFFWGYAVHRETYQLIYNYKPDMENVIPPFKDGEVLEMFEEVAKTGKLLAIHAENNELIEVLTERIEQSGRRDYEALIEARPSLAEKTTIQTGIAFAEETGARLHILHISSADGIEEVKRAQAKSLPITAETCPHYLFLNNESYKEIGPHMKVYPPVKYKRDQERMWTGIEEGVISSVCSDHAPHTEEEKDGDLWSIPAGMCGVETLAPLMLNAVSEGKLVLEDVVKLMSENPAKQYGIYPQKGSFAVGTDADLTIVDMDKEYTIQREKLHSKSKVTAYDGFSIKGAPVGTIVRGKTVMLDGEIKAEAEGQFISSSE